MQERRKGPSSGERILEGWREEWRKGRKEGGRKGESGREEEKGREERKEEIENVLVINTLPAE